MSDHPDVPGRERDSDHEEPVRMYVDGEWYESESEQRATAIDPATGESIATVPNGTRGDVRAAIDAAAAVQEELEFMTAFERAELCYDIADVLEAERDWLAEWLTRDQGKPLAEAGHELADTIANFRNAGEYVKHDTTEVLNSRDPDKRVITIRKPRGVYGVITPWNFPVGNPAEHIAAALAVGNSVVWAPAPSTAVVAAKFTELLDRTDLPDGAVNLVLGDGQVVGNELVVSDGVDAIGFTGSTATGRAITRDAGTKHVLLELGGNGPIVVLDDADVDAAVEGTALSCFYNAGQVCTASERVLVHEDVADAVADGLVDWAESITVGDPMADDTDMGPLNNDQVAEKMDRHVEDALDRGATLLAGGERVADGPTDRYYEPTVLAGVTEEMLVSSEETFGPIAPLTTFSTYEEALEIANRDEYGLTSAVFTSNIKAMEYFVGRMESGTVMVNDGSGYWENQLPMGGYSGKQSGHGRRGGKFTIEEMSQLKTVVVDHDNVVSEALDG